MKPAKPIIAHLVTALFTGSIAFWIVAHPQLYSSIPNDEALLWGALVVGALVYFIIIWIVDRVISYIWFCCSNEYGICGLYVEAFLDGALRANLSLMVVYYDLARHELKITGYSYHQSDLDKTKLIPWASWESCGLHHTVNRNYADIFYIHEGNVGDTGHDNVRGTTICRLPSSHTFFQSGSFWDLKHANQAGVRPMPFEIIKADNSSQKLFFDGITGWRARSVLKLAAPAQDYFFAFVSRHGVELIDPTGAVYRGPMMFGIWETLSISMTARAAATAPASAAPGVTAPATTAPGTTGGPAVVSLPAQTGDVATVGSEKVIRDRLTTMLQNSFAPYSNFRVAAAIVDEGGSVYYGVNIENQSFSVATCAEAGAIAAMHLAGGKEIKKLYLLSEPNIAVVPCGACRQRLAEFGKADTQVTTFRKDGHHSTYRLEELFPHSFRFK